MSEFVARILRGVLCLPLLIQGPEAIDRWLTAAADSTSTESVHSWTEDVQEK